MKKHILFGGVCLGLVGCVVTIPKQWEPIGGSRADGVVKVAYQVDAYETAEVSQQQALETAAKSCKAWGFAGAEPFGLESRACKVYFGRPGESKCRTWVVSKPFQCSVAAGKQGVP